MFLLSGSYSESFHQTPLGFCYFKTHSSRLIQTEQERDRISAERARLELQVAKMKMTESNLIKEHAESLERSKNSWTQKWPRWTEVGDFHTVDVRRLFFMYWHLLKYTVPN